MVFCGAPAAWAAPADCVRRARVHTRRLSGVCGAAGKGELAPCRHQGRALPRVTRGHCQAAGTGLSSVPGRRQRSALLRSEARCQPCSHGTGTWCQRGPCAGEAGLLAGSAGPSSAAGRRQGCAPPCAEARRQPGASTSGRGTEYAPDYAGQYDYAPPPGGCVPGCEGCEVKADGCCLRLALGAPDQILNFALRAGCRAATSPALPAVHGRINPRCQGQLMFCRDSAECSGVLHPYLQGRPCCKHSERHGAAAGLACSPAELAWP